MGTQGLFSNGYFRLKLCKLISRTLAEFQFSIILHIFEIDN